MEGCIRILARLSTGVFVIWDKTYRQAIRKSETFGGLPTFACFSQSGKTIEMDRRTCWYKLLKVVHCCTSLVGFEGIINLCPLRAFFRRFFQLF